MIDKTSGREAANLIEGKIELERDSGPVDNIVAYKNNLFVARLRFSDSDFFHTQIFLNHCFWA